MAKHQFPFGIGDPTLIFAGQEIVIPEDESVATKVPPLPLPRGCASTWTVQAGDTLFSIAETCDVTTEALLAVNPQIADPTQLEVGDVLTIPERSLLEGQISVEQMSAAPGETVNIVGSGFAPSIDLEIGFGRVESEYDIIGAARTTIDGSFRTTVTIPEFANPDDEWVFVAVAPNGFTVNSDVFSITNN